MNKIEILKMQATRQFRHNDDNSPNLAYPKDGFVIAYDRKIMDVGIDGLAGRIAELEAQLVIAEDGWHMANGVADLAMKHRDAAEKALERVRGELDALDSEFNLDGWQDEDAGVDEATTRIRAAINNPHKTEEQ